MYTITAPKINDFDFVLAVDSSGSLGPSENDLEGPAVATAVPDFIEGIANNYSRTSMANFNISIVSWNDKIDFASSDFTNKDSSKAKLFSINKSINNIDTFINEFTKSYNYTDETAGTNISVAIRTSNDVLNADMKPNVDYHKTKKFIILVTGKGEFKPCNRDLMNAVQKKYEIFTIGLDVPISSYLYSHLKDLAMNKNHHWSFVGAAPGSLQGSLDQELEIALRDALDNATKSAVAYNVKIVESLYSYYTPNLASFTIDGVPINGAFVHKSTNLLDGTSTITLDLPEGLRPNSKTVVSFTADFNPGYLPVTITNDRKPITLCSPAGNTQLAAFSYDWFNGEPFKIKLE